MKLKFYGTRGSIPICDAGFQQFGGNTSQPSVRNVIFWPGSVQLERMGASFEFRQIADASKHFSGINNVEILVTAQSHNHPGGADSFRIEQEARV